MQFQILFLTDGSFHDAVAYSLLCYYAQQNKTPITVVFANEPGYHNKISNGFNSNTIIKFVSRFHVSISYLDSYELDQLDEQFVTLHDLCRAFKIPQGIEIVAGELDTESSFYLPSIIGNLLLHRMGFIEFGNYIAHKWLNNANWDIVRDQGVIDTVSPLRDDHVVVS